MVSETHSPLQHVGLSLSRLRLMKWTIASPCAWVWMYQGEQKMFMDLEEPIRVRVQSVRFPEQPRSTNELAGVGAAGGVGALGGATPDGTFAPLVVQGDINADGLGLLSWWGQ